jgi:hypothetical protein|tara:strand:+ start:192 stop:440 length:249 start_codon:yes stop_codon:yes gene_type:complete
MLIEGLGNVTFVNGILRVQCTSVDPAGKQSNSGVLEIPGASVNNIINGLVGSAKAIEDKLASLEDDNKKDTSKESKKKSKKK